MVDHQIAHIYIKDNKNISKEKIKITIEEISGIESVCDEKGKQNLHIDHPRSGDLVAIAKKTDGLVTTGGMMTRTRSA